MNVLDVTKKCVGCGACVDVCPVEALGLQHNADGFYEPTVVRDTCVDCGKCQKVCPALNLATRENTGDFYCGWHTDEKIRKASSSGGAFTALAENVLAAGGVVFGARYCDDFRGVEMDSTENVSLDALRRSKYCQANPKGMYRKIAALLKEGRQVMLVGTPCQIAAARREFGNHEQLLLVDFLCGGVATETAFADYISHMERKYGSPVKSVNFRDKRLGWSKPGISIKFENGKTYFSAYQLDSYYYYYCTPFTKNESCITCAFTQHPDADITIADFWGYEKTDIAKNESGMSLICVYTDKGRGALDGIRPGFVLHSLQQKHVEYAYKEKSHSPERVQMRSAFLEQVRTSSFMEAAKKDYFRYGKLGALWKIIIRKVTRR